MNSRLEAALFIASILIAGALSWWLMLRSVEDADPTRFDSLPRAIRGWEAIDVEMDQQVTEMLAADHNVQRAYVHPQHYVVFAYVGYYGTERGGTPEHTPDFCYPAQGWAIVDASDRRVGGAQGFDVREFLVEKDGERRLVHFWYRTSHATGITSIFGLRWQHFWDRLIRNRADGALIRLSTSIAGDDVAAARSRLLGLDDAFEEALALIWREESSTWREESSTSQEESSTWREESSTWREESSTSQEESSTAEALRSEPARPRRVESAEALVGVAIQ